MKKVFVSIVFISIIWNLTEAQKNERKLVQLTGRMFDELYHPLPYAHILVLNNYRGTITDRDGKFSFVTQEKDSIMFSTVGYKRKIIVVPDTFQKPFYILDIFLEQDTFLIAEAVIYPWRTYEEFKEAFINLKLPEDDMERARKNIALLKTQIILDETPNSRENFQKILNQQYRETFTQGTYPTYQIFNIFAWADFFEALKRGDFKKYSNPTDE